jgi:AcrR family transcriptional regulator
MKRDYESPARRAAKQVTRDRILDALVEVVTREGVHAFTVQNVANAAGVAHRTVYRHFATREALLDGLDELIECRSRAAGIVPPDLGNAADLAAMAEQGYGNFDAFGDAMRAYVVISIALGRRVPGFDERTRAIRASIRGAYPGVTPAEVEEAAAVIRLLMGARAWFLLTKEQDMTTAAASRAVSRAIEALLSGLRARSNPQDP